MKKIYYLGTCDDCKKVMKRLGGMKDFEKQEIKTEPVTAAQLKRLKELAGSHEAIFSKKARKYNEMKLKDKNLSENEIRDLILSEYTFLRRPLIVVDDRLFIGHQDEMIEALEHALSK